MKKSIISLKAALLALCLLMAARASAYTLGDETLHYDIVYHWGIIWKHAGSATLTMKKAGANHNAMLAARTISWADKVYKVRDTLSCTIGAGLRPAVYRKASHEGKHNGVDIVSYSYDGNVTKAQCVRHRPGKPDAKTSLQCTGRAYDMLSVFYYLRSLNYGSMSNNVTYTTTIFSGKRKETLRIRVHGVESIELRDKSKHQAYHISFTFTSDGQKKSSDDMHTWISTDASHRPLMMKGKLPIGEVRCYLSK